jgi:hypothetical protein
VGVRGLDISSLAGVTAGYEFWRQKNSTGARSRAPRGQRILPTPPSWSSAALVNDISPEASGDLIHLQVLRRPKQKSPLTSIDAVRFDRVNKSEIHAVPVNPKVSAAAPADLGDHASQGRLREMDEMQVMQPDAERGATNGFSTPETGDSGPILGFDK